jgi:hypothetical protein
MPFFVQEFDNVDNNNGVQKKSSLSGRGEKSKLKYENADIEDGASGDISEDEFDRMSQVI